MKLEYKLKNESLYVALSGELDHCCADKVRTKLDDLFNSTNCKKVIFDFENLNFMDSTGIGLLIGRYKLLKARNIPLYISRPSESVDKILKLSGVYNVINLY